MACETNSKIGCIHACLKKVKFNIAAKWEKKSQENVLPCINVQKSFCLAGSDVVSPKRSITLGRLSLVSPRSGLFAFVLPAQ